MITFAKVAKRAWRPAPIRKAALRNEPLVLYVLADKRMPAVKRAFLRSVAATQDAVVLADVEDALAMGNIAAVEGLIDWTAFGGRLVGLQNELLQLVQVAGETTTAPLGISFDLLNPRVVENVRNHGAELVKQVTDDTRQAIRGTVERGLQDAIGPDELARQVRSFIGLTEQQSTAVSNLRDTLIGDGKTLGQVEEQTIAYATRLRDSRAEMIARTETIRAAATGQREAWSQEVEQGLVSGEEFEREWIADPDACDDCLEMDGKRAPVDGAYDSGDDGPPLHPNCRCAEGLVPIDKGDEN